MTRDKSVRFYLSSMKTSHDEAAVHYGVSSFNLVIEYPPVRRLAKSSIRSNYLSVLIYYSEELYEGLSPEYTTITVAR